MNNLSLINTRKTINFTKFADVLISHFFDNLNFYHSIVWGTKTSFPLILTIIYPSILFFFLFINFSFTSLSFSYCMASSFSLAAIISFVTSPAVLNAMHQQQHPIIIRKTITTINTIKITIPLFISEL